MLLISVNVYAHVLLYMCMLMNIALGTRQSMACHVEYEGGNFDVIINTELYIIIPSKILGSRTQFFSLL